MTTEERPWLMLTLRRTGGTSLTMFLQSVSSFPLVEHEPFNPDRKLGWVTVAFRHSDDRAALVRDMETALAERPNIKHCIDVARPELTAALIGTCAGLGYRFLVLTRRDEAARLGSLALAIATGAWGTQQARKIYPQIRDGSRQAAPIDLDWLEQQVRIDFALLGRCLSTLRNRGIDYRWLVFEELYQGGTPVRDQARALAAEIGVAVADSDPRLEAFSHRAPQGSHDIAPHVPGHDAAMALLYRLCPD